MRMDRLLISGITLVTPHTSPVLADILMHDGHIEAIEPSSSLTIDADRIDGAPFIAIPGLVNAHTHSHNALSKGLGDVWSLELLLNYGPALNARRRPEDHYWAAMLN